MSIFAKAPIGLGLYDRGNESVYRGDDRGNGAAGYAASLGCSWIAVNASGRDRDKVVREARQMGLDVALWTYPDTWKPANWRATLAHIVGEARRLGAAWIIVDQETASDWRSAGPEERAALAHAMAEVRRQGLGVIWTSFPTWPWWREVAAIAGPAGVVGSPQVYGVISPGSNAELRRRLDSWRDAGWHDVFPSLAAWKRGAQPQAAYLAAFTGERAGCLWTSASPPRIGTPTHRAIASGAGIGEDFRQRRNGALVAGVACALVAAGLALGGK